MSVGDGLRYSDDRDPVCSSCVPASGPIACARAIHRRAAEYACPVEVTDEASAMAAVDWMLEHGHLEMTPTRTQAARK